MPATMLRLMGESDIIDIDPVAHDGNAHPRLMGLDADDRINLYRRMRRAGGRAANQEGLHHAATFHFGCHIDHFIKAWRDETRQADHINIFLYGRIQNGFSRHHDA